MQLDCLTAESCPSTALWSIHRAKRYFSLPLINFPLSLNILFPCMLSSLTVLRFLLCPTPCPCFFLYCALPLFLLPPVLSSHGWCVGCAAGGQVMHCRSWGYENISAGRKVHKANMHRKHLPPKTVTPTKTNQQRQLKVSDFLSKKNKQTGLDSELWPFKGRGSVVFFPKESESRSNKYSYTGWAQVTASKRKHSTDRAHRLARIRWELVCDLKPKQWHPLCISSYLKMTRLHFCGIQYVMSYDLYVLYCSYSSL